MILIWDTEQRQTSEQSMRRQKEQTGQRKGRLEREGVLCHSQKKGLRLKEGKNVWNWELCSRELRGGMLLST